jgi:hypothetical protein
VGCDYHDRGPMVFDGNFVVEAFGFCGGDFVEGSPFCSGRGCHFEVCRDEIL